MIYKRSLPLALLFIFLVATLVVIATQNLRASPGIINVPGDYEKIQWAVGNATAGDTIIVAAGTYDEQVIIDKSLTLEGVGSATIIKPSSAATLTQVFDGLFWYGTPNTKNIAGIIVANVPDGSNVTIKNLKVDESSVTTKPTGADYLVGIFYRETGGTIDSVEIAGTGAWSGADRAYGIYLSAATNPVFVEIKSSTITSFDKNGIEAHGNKLTFNIHHNVLTGRGSVSDEVQNGIHAGRGSVGTIHHNVISDLAYQPETWWAAAVLLYDYLLEGLSQWTADNNNITNCQIGMIFINGDCSAQSNNVNGGTVGLVGLSSEPEQAGSWIAFFINNTVTGIKDSLGYENAAIDAQTYDAGATLTVTIRNNTLLGGGSTDADGVYVGGDAGSVTAKISGNLISGWNHGINLASACVAEATIINNTVLENVGAGSGIHVDTTVNATNVHVNLNNIVGNTGEGVHGVSNLGSGILDAENNWWGDASGPSGAGPGTGDAVSSNVDFTPWLHGEYALMVNITYPTEGAYLDSVPVIWINGTISETSWMGRQPQINDTSFALDLASWNGTHFAFYNVTSIADGLHSYIVNFTDLADNTASDTVTFTVDTVPPVVDITSPLEGSYVSASFSINGTVTELNIGGLKPTINDTRFNLTYWNSTTGAFGFKNNTAISDCPISVMVNFTDLAGNVGNRSVSFVLDSTAPTTPTNFAVTVFDGNATFTWTASTDNSAVKGYYLKLNTEIYYVGNFTNYTRSGLSAGTYTARVWSTDIAENNSTDTMLTFTVTQKADIIDVSCPTSVYRGQWLLLNVTVQNVGNLTGVIFVNVSDTTGVLANKTITMVSNTTNVVTFNLTAPTSLGLRTLNVTAGHGVIIDDSWVVIVEVLNRAPVASFTYSPGFPITGEIVTFNALTSFDPDGTITNYLWNFGDGINGTGLATNHVYNIFGIYNVTLIVIDNDGLTNSTSKLVNIRQRPTANFTFSPKLPLIGETVTFNASLSKPNGGDITTYSWDFGDNQTGTGILINHTYSNYGTYNVTLTVTDTELLSNNFTQTIRIAIGPTASFMYAPIYPIVNQSVLFASMSYDPDGTVVAYTWNFDDGNITTVGEPFIRHAFEKENTYNVTLTVTDDDGLNHTITKQIIVYTTPTSVRDIAIVSIDPESVWVFQGQILNIRVTVTNQGTDLETFNVTLYYNTAEIGAFTVINLFPNENLTITFAWNTTNVYPAPYNISAAATILPEEIDTADNALSYETINVLWMGDINHDGKVDMRDIAAIARGFGSKIGDPRYDPKCDLNKDGKIEMRDIAPAAKNFGKP